MRHKVSVCAAFLLILTGSNVLAAVPEAERDALVALYNATDGENWNNKANWLTGDPCVNSWFGVTCNAEGTTVTELFSNFNNLAGAIPPDLGNLTNLLKLNLGQNVLTSIPAEIGNLTNLQALYIFSSSLTGPIPASLGNLASLQELHLNNNQLDGIIPPELANLTNLKRMLLEHNQLSGPIPPELGNLTNLTWLHLYDNQLTGSIPASLGNLDNLQYFAVYSNELSGSIPAELGGLANLEELRLNDNQLSGSIPPELGSLSALRALFLQNNRLTGSMSASLGELSNLNRLWVHGNGLSGEVPSHIGDLSKLYNGDGINFRWNALQTANGALDDFLDLKEGGDWSVTQTAAPANVQVDAVMLTAVTLAWDAIEYTGNTGRYRVWYGTTPGGPYTNEGGATVNKSQTTLTVSDLAPETTYYFVVRTETESHDNNQNDVVSGDSSVIDQATTDSIFSDGFEEGVQ